ncbi:MAG: NADH-quinone oxidoreductase subunit NuoH [Planctomycetota bacterium]|jgi:NADH-quinone oxidoreductase subunit H
MSAVEVIVTLLKVFVVFGFAMSATPILVYAERRLCGFIQDRLGPNRVGPQGLLQPIADAVKSLFKEDIVIPHAEKFLWIVAPAVGIVIPCLCFVVIPFGSSIRFSEEYSLFFQLADPGIGILWVLGVISLGVFGIAMAGWASNSKYPLLGSLRVSAQMVSYEIAMGLAVLSVVMSTGSLQISQIVAHQTGPWLGVFPQWHCFTQPLAFLVFVVSAVAENNRLPFDLPECESELVSGYHTEYSSMKFAMFMMGEYTAMSFMSALIVTLFLGGWSVPWIDLGTGHWLGGLASLGVFFTKWGLVAFVYIWLRWSLPRFRYDQLMGLGWKTLVPLGLANVAITGFIGVMK